MLGDNDADTRNIGVTKVLALRKQIAKENEENKSHGNCSNSLTSNSVRVSCSNFQLGSKKYAD